MKTIEKKLFEQLFRTEYPRLIRLASIMLHSTDEGKDVVSQVFTELWAGAISLPEGKEQSYLSMAVRNRCINIIRQTSLREKILRRLPLPPLTTPLHLTDTEEERWQRIERIAHEVLPTQTARVFGLRYIEEKKYREIAHELGINEAAVYKHLAQALKKIRRQFDAEEEAGKKSYKETINTFRT